MNESRCFIALITDELKSAFNKAHFDDGALLIKEERWFVTSECVVKKPI